MIELVFAAYLQGQLVAFVAYPRRFTDTDSCIATMLTLLARPVTPPFTIEATCRTNQVREA